LGTDGKAIPEAKLIMFWFGDRKPESFGKSAEDGSFRVTVPWKDRGGYLLAQTEGYGVDFLELPSSGLAKVTFQLPKDSPIRGWVLDTQGKPVGGVEVSVRDLQMYQKNSATPFLDQWKTRHFQDNLPRSDKSMWSANIQNRLLPNGKE